MLTGLTDAMSDKDASLLRNTEKKYWSTWELEYPCLRDRKCTFRLF